MPIQSTFKQCGDTFFFFFFLVKFACFAHKMTTLGSMHKHCSLVGTIECEMVSLRAIFDTNPINVFGSLSILLPYKSSSPEQWNRQPHSLLPCSVRAGCSPPCRPVGETLLAKLLPCVAEPADEIMRAIWWMRT